MKLILLKAIQMKKSKLSEAFASKLIKVSRLINRGTASGRNAKVNHVLHVKGVSPGDKVLPPDDRDSSVLSGHEVKKASGINVKNPNPKIDKLQVEPEVDQETGLPGPDPNLINRMTVSALEYESVVDSKKNKKDPIPAEIRKKVAAGKTGIATFSYKANAVTAVPITPGDKILWGVVEEDLIERLRSGRYIYIKQAPSFNSTGFMFGKVETPDGVVHPVIIKSEVLSNYLNYEVWDELYSLRKESFDISKRDAAVYEASKVFGLDDLVIPTVVRDADFDSFGYLMDKSLLESKTESVATRLGVSSDELASKIKGASSVSFHPKITKLLTEEVWFDSLFPEKGGEVTDSLNNFWNLMRPEVRMGLLRVCALDFIVWSGNRTLCSILIGDEKHPVMVMDNQISIPDPKALCKRYEINPKFYTGDPLVAGEAYPLLWSDFNILLSVRGNQQELDDFQKIALSITEKANDSRLVDMINSLRTHGIPADNIAGMIARILMLKTHAIQIARDPFIYLKYLLAMRNGQELEAATGGVSAQDEFSHIEEKINTLMSKGGFYDYSFVDSLRGENE